MIQANKISTALLGIVGFRQPHNPDYAIVDTDNLASTSGYYVNDNPYAKIEFIKENQDYASISDENFNLFLKNLQKSSISNVCNQVFSEADFIDRGLIYKNAANKTETEILPLGFVGYKIQVTSEKNVAFKINRVLCNFDGTGTVKLLLFNTAKKETIQSKEITITTDHQVVELDWICDNSDSTYKGDYYIGYLSQDLTVMPFKRQWNGANVMSEITNLCIHKVAFVGHSTEILFDLTTMVGMYEDTGLNLDISVYEDFTDFVINNKNLFARAIYLNMILDCLQLYISSTRKNPSERDATGLVEKMLVEMQGVDSRQGIKVIGIKDHLLGEITTIKKEVEKLQKGFFKKGQILVSTLQ